MQYVLTKEELEELQKNKEALTVDIKKEVLGKCAEKIQQFNDSLRKRVRAAMQGCSKDPNCYIPYAPVPITLEELRVLLHAIQDDADKIVL
jgi:hypothetical protein